jgi:hypothetical protein
VFDSATALAALALLACVHVFTDKTVEVRPDAGLILFGVLTVWMLLRAMQARRPRPVYVYSAVAGCALGLATLFSTKSMMLAIALCAALTYLAIRRRRAISRSAALGGIGSFSAGFLVAVLPCCVYFFSRGALGNMLRFTIIDNVLYPERFSALRWLQPTWSTPLAVALALGMLLMLLSKSGNPPRRDAVLLVAIVGLALVVQFALIMPAPYAQSVCLSIVFLVIPAGWLLRSAIGWITDQRRTTKQAWCAGCVALLILLAGPVDSLLSSPLSHQGDAPELERQIAHTQRLLELTGPNDAVFAASPAAIFRHHACFHPTLTYGVLQRYRSGQVETCISEDLRRYECTLIVTAHPPRPIPESDRAFIQNHFVAHGPSIQVPGQRYVAEQLTEGTVTFEAVAGGVYELDANGPVSINGEPVATEVDLEPGSHTINCAAESAPVRIFRRPGQ